ncbi:AI-2E family transporter [Balneolaceae bacterium YR4-1]|uniref:AI-2E family transporter n=1 Tax=Halalkalibaculum roseum TaxID=2709311 RepID=A0A6M1STM8_9BACT|nr:AI-2E family transporter [Halalkalibaculum roseum]NGP76172.1 AI-2E family transporter [Halalkalibaculum roseum]
MKKYPFWLKFTIILLGLILFYIVLVYGKFILMPIAMSALLAMLLEPLSGVLEKLKIGRMAAILLSLLLVIIVTIGIFSLLSIQFVQFADRLPEANEKLQVISSNLLTFFQDIFGIAPEQQVDFLQQGLSNVIDRSGEYLSTAVGATTSVFTTLTILPFFVFFMMYYKEMYQTFIHQAFKGEETRAIDSVIEEVQAVTQNYIVGMISVIGILGILNFIGLWLIGLEHALFFSAFAAILAVIPYIGIIIGSLPAILFALLFTDSLLTPLGVIGVFSIVQFLEGNFITPNIIGSQVSINPFMALIALIIGGEVWGIAGMILFVPFLGILRCVLVEVDDLRPYGYLLGNNIRYKFNSGSD